MKTYLAKSYPQESIQEHTDYLIQNYYLLKSIYPNLEIDWDILYLACLYHDLGKINSKFQSRISIGKKFSDEIPHSYLSLAFINGEELVKEGYSKMDIKLLAHAIAYHHDRKFDYDSEIMDREIELLKIETGHFIYHKTLDLRAKKLNFKYFQYDRIYEKDDNYYFYKYIKIKGLLNRLDYAASAHIEVEHKNDFLLDSMANVICEWKKANKKADWNSLQRFMISNQDSNVIVVAQTGMGKTEAGLLWIGENKGFFTLPLKTAINSIYYRVSHQIIKTNHQDRVGLLHSDTYSEYIKINDENIDYDEYYNKTKQLSLPLTICTLDQLFDFVFRYRGFELKLATLSFSKVVIDEIQMYSPDLLAYLLIGLSYISKVGGKFAILTATLPKFIIDMLNEMEIDYKIPEEPFIDDSYNRHSLLAIEDKLNIDYIINQYNSNKILVICNTVRKAQEIYNGLKENGIEDINLFHSGFIKKHRKEKETLILRFGNKDLKESGIWIATQVVEASLDIDFDILITELSDINGLLQRMGRCFRKRPYSGIGRNCHVFVGSDKEKVSGIGYVIDREIFILSRNIILNWDGIISEKDKLLLINSIYSTEKLKDTDYYKLVVENIKYLKSIEDFEKSKSEVARIFRSINTVTVIPSEIFIENKDEIMNYAEIILRSYPKSLSTEERKIVKIGKTIARDNLMGFTVNVLYAYTENNIKDYIQISKTEYIPVLNCIYSEEQGVTVTKNKKGETSIEDKFF